MSAFILNILYGINSVQYKSVKKERKSIIFSVEMKKQKIKCKKCGNSHLHFKGRKTRRFRMVPLNSKKCFLEVLLHRLHCPNCGNIWWPKLPFMKGNLRMVKSFIKYTLDLLSIATIKGVSRILGVHWNTVKKIHKTKLQKQFKKISLNLIEYVTVDEISIGKGHDYMTIFADLRSGTIIHAVEGRKLEAIEPFLRKLLKEASSLKAISMDMSRSYSSAVKTILPHIDIVFDHFHVNAVMNRALDDLRKDQENSNVLKGKRFLLLRNYEDLNSSQSDRLNELFEVNKPLFIAHSLKEQFRLFWKQDNIEKAIAYLYKWCFDALATGIKQLKRVVKTIARHQEGILNYFKHRITNGKAEGLNNKAKAMLRQAYGFRDMEYLKLRLYNLHNQGYAFVG